jgi:hypothetical protein
MLTLKDFFEVIDYKVTEGSAYQWECFGPKAFAIDYWDGAEDGASLTVIFDTETQVVYSAQACDCNNGRAYRWMHPDFKDAHANECQVREVKDEAWDNISWTDLEVTEDWISKARAIVKGQEYDTRIQVPINLPDEEMLQLFLMAHERDITLNQMVEEILREQIDRLSRT